MKFKLIFFMMIFFGAACAHTITMNMAYKITDNDVIRANGTDYIFHTNNIAMNFTDPEKKYIGSSASESAAGIIFAGSQFLGISINTIYSSSSYNIAMIQGESENRFIIFFARGNHTDAEEKSVTAADAKYLPKTVGNISSQIPVPEMIYLRLEYPDIDIISKSRWSQGLSSLLIKNAGRADGIAKVSMEII